MLVFVICVAQIIFMTIFGMFAEDKGTYYKFFRMTMRKNSIADIISTIATIVAFVTALAVIINYVW